MNLFQSLRDNKVVAGGIAAAVAISSAGLLFIGQKEGKENAPYRDIAGVWTVCYGSTGAHVRSGGVRSDEECLTLLDQDVDRFEAAVNRCTPPRKTQNEFDAMVSFSFNIGEQGYCNSTFARKFNSGDKVGAANAMLAWDKARVNGVLVSVRGLRLRREAERTLFLTPPPAVAVDGQVPIPVQSPCPCADAPVAPAQTPR